MKKLTNKEWYQKLKQVKEMVNYPHEDYEVQKIFADLYATLAEGYIWEFPKIKWREWKLKKAIKMHAKCCDLS